MKVLVIGSGGREHCLVWKIAHSPLVKKIYCACGNGGTVDLAENVDISPNNVRDLVRFAQEKRIDLTVVGPEAPLVGGIVDKFEEKGLRIFGPKKDLAILEGSKVFAKEIMQRLGIPTANFRVFYNFNEAKDYIYNRGVPIVIKADGLASGKGVIVANSLEEAEKALELIMVKKEFGQAGDRIVIEDYLKGEEASILAFIDGKNILPLVSSQDHKPLFDGDKGPNTGGMGAYAPAPIVGEDIFNKIIEKIFKPLILGLNKDGKFYKGVLYAGLMIKDNEPFVLEFNVRFGDPETQVILPKLKNDLVEVILATIEGRLDRINLDWDERFCLCVVLANGGYPSTYEKGKDIFGLEKISCLEDILVFHAGTVKLEDKVSKKVKFLTNGGRVINIVGLAKDLVDAQKKVYSAIENVYFENIHYRKDIGDKALKYLQT
ncbi:MAG: phosphoribosylamine--glycine ligase [Candidatus Omnitrophica bacterium]|nr:phosphoribosylamine--glycine ligase [Candidatus Omnitrophota bacterium]MCM8826240.1 phosphoribosylamine--glycine ligase [Candidatus Omnitrophota bacterium]